MKEYIAIGPREQDFCFTNHFFDGSVTLYGSGTEGNISYCRSRGYRINHNIFRRDQEQFVDSELLKKIEENPDVRFMSYDPNLAYKCDERIIERTVCLNDKQIMDLLNDKISFRKWAADVCTLHEVRLLRGDACDYAHLRSVFGFYQRFVIQKSRASGGEGTFILTEQNETDILGKLDQQEQYLVSGYEEYNIPVNMHAIIYDKEILLFPPSIQIMRFCGEKLLYQGADFVAVDQISTNVLREFDKYMTQICKKLQREGYRGVTGVDAMIVHGNIYILEMNNRFQGSTLLLNLALKDQGLPSMQELNFDAFCKEKAECTVQDLKVPYSCFTYIANDSGRCPRGHCRIWENDAHVVAIYDEGLCYDEKMDAHATLERVVFDTNIVSITPKANTALHPSILDLSDEWIHRIVDQHDWLYLKIALINLGVRIEQGTEDYLNHQGGIREAVYNAVDIYFPNGLVVNSAVKVKFAHLSPFEIRMNKQQRLLLHCCNEFVTEISIQRADALGEKEIRENVRAKDICLLATDRVRIQHSKNCCFKRSHVGCDFCEVEDHEFSFEMSDIEKAIDLYKYSDYEFRHFLIGGRSDVPEREADEIVQIAQYICKDQCWPIYVMCVPPKDKTVLDRFFDAHVTELALNIEIWDRSLAKKWMPGKGSIPLDRYLEMLKYAVQLWGNTGNVRSAFIVGLEPVESLMEGIRTVCSLGVAPILSVFRPIPGTKGDPVAPLSNEQLLDIYVRAQSICHEYGLRLGPECVPCQNNTLSMPGDWAEEESYESFE